VLKKLLFNIYFWTLFVLITGVGLLVLPLILCVNVFLQGRSLSSGLRRAIRFYGWVLVRFASFLGPVRVEFCGDHLPAPVIFVANHNSAIDPYLFGLIATENGFVTSWPFKIPVYNIFMRLAGYVNAEAGWEKVRENCRRLLEAGSSVTIWPEGHRSRDGRLGRFKNGAFALSVETGFPVVPVCIIGSGKVLPPGCRVLTPEKVSLVVLEPIYPESSDLKTEEKIQRLRSRVFAGIEETLRDREHFQYRFSGADSSV
jgi:1-acyl-sn-glycerol-3-phosphate acyltransferase